MSRQQLDSVQTMHDNAKAFDNLGHADSERYQKNRLSTKDEDDDDEEENVPPPLPASRPPTAPPSSFQEPVPYFPIDIETSSGSLNGRVLPHSGVTTPCFSVVSCSSDSEEDKSRTLSEFEIDEKIPERPVTSEEPPSRHRLWKRNDFENVDEYESRRLLSISEVASTGAAPIPSKSPLISSIGLRRFHLSHDNRDEEEVAENSASVNESHHRLISANRRDSGGAKEFANQSYQQSASKPRLVTLPSQHLLSVYDRQTNFITRPKSAGHPCHSKDSATASTKDLLQPTQTESPSLTKSNSPFRFHRRAASPAQTLEGYGLDKRLHASSDNRPSTLDARSTMKISSMVVRPDRLPISVDPTVKSPRQHRAPNSDSTDSTDSLARESEKLKSHDVTRLSNDARPLNLTLATPTVESSHEQAVTVSKITLESQVETVNRYETPRWKRPDNLDSRTARQCTETSKVGLLNEQREKSKRDKSDQPDHRNDHRLRVRDLNVREPVVKGRDLGDTYLKLSYMDRPSVGSLPRKSTTGRSHPGERIPQPSERSHQITSKGQSNQTDESKSSNRSYTRESSFEQLVKKLRDDSRGRIQKLIVSPGSGQSRPASNSTTSVSSLPVIAKQKPSLGTLLPRDQQRRSASPYEAVMSPLSRFKSPPTEFTSSAALWGDAGAWSKRRTTSLDEPSYWGTRSLPRNMDSLTRWSVNASEDFDAGESDASDAKRVSCSSTESARSSFSNARDSNQGRKEGGYYSENPEILRAKTKGCDREDAETSLEPSPHSNVAAISPDSAAAFTRAVPTLTPVYSQPFSVAPVATYSKPGSRPFFSPHNFSASSVSRAYSVHHSPSEPFISQLAKSRLSSLINSDATVSSSFSVPDIPPARYSRNGSPVIPPYLPASDPPTPPRASPLNGHPPLASYTTLSLRASIAPPLHVHPFAKVNHDAPSTRRTLDGSISNPTNHLSSNSASNKPPSGAISPTTYTAASANISSRIPASTNLASPSPQYSGSSTFASSHQRLFSPNSHQESASHTVPTSSSPHPFVQDHNFAPAVPPPLPAVGPPHSFPTESHTPPSDIGLPEDLFSVTEVKSDPRHLLRSSNSTFVFPSPMSKHSTKSPVTANETRIPITNKNAYLPGVRTNGLPEDRSLKGSEPDKSFTYFPISHSDAGSGRDRVTEKTPASIYKSNLSISLMPFVDLEDDDDATGSARVSSRISEDGTQTEDMTVGGLVVSQLQSTHQNGSKVNNLQSTGSQVNHFQSTAPSVSKVNHPQSTAPSGYKDNHLQSTASGESKVDHLQSTASGESKTNHLQSTASSESKVNHLQSIASSESKDVDYLQPMTQPGFKVNHFQSFDSSGSKINNLKPTAQSGSLQVNHLLSTKTADSLGGSTSSPERESTPRSSIVEDNRTKTDSRTRISFERIGRSEIPMPTSRVRSGFPPKSEYSVDNGDSSLLEIDIVKGSIGICFCLEGGRDSPYGDGPIRIKRLFQAGTPDFSVGKERLRPGDELVSVNGEDLTAATHYTAWTFLRTLPEGLVRLVVRRNPHPQGAPNNP